MLSCLSLIFLVLLVMEKVILWNLFLAKFVMVTVACIVTILDIKHIIGHAINVMELEGLGIVPLTFVRTKWNYDSYKDFWKLVELSGFPFCYVDEVDPCKSDMTYIVSPLNGEWLELMDAYNHSDVRSKLIHWNLERPGGSGNLQSYIQDNNNLIDCGYFHYVIVSDRNLANETGYHYVPLGIHEGLGSPGTEKIYDLIHLSCYSPHRAVLFVHPDRPRLEMFGLKIAPNGWDDERHMLLQASKAMLGIHQDGLPYCEPLRLAIGVAYGLILVWEECDTYPYNAIKFALGDIGTPKRAKELFRTLYKIINIDNYNHGLFIDQRDHMLKEFTFRQCLERYL